MLYSEPSSPPRKKQRNTRSGYIDDELPKVQKGIALPNPHFFRIHSAIAGILEMSKVSEEIDAAINGSRGAGTSGPVIEGDDLENFFLRESVGAIMKDLTVK